MISTVLYNMNAYSYELSFVHGPPSFGIRIFGGALPMFRPT